MKTIIIDLKNIQRLGQVWQKFADAFHFPDEEEQYKISFPKSNIKLEPPEVWKRFSWDAFWEYFRDAVDDLTKNGQKVKLIVKNASEVKKFGLLYPGADKTHYDVLIECLKDATDPKKVFAYPERAHPLNFTYELIEDKPQKEKL